MFHFHKVFLHVLFFFNKSLCLPSPVTFPSSTNIILSAPTIVESLYAIIKMVYLYK